jgi:hypothetical protein
LTLNSIVAPARVVWYRIESSGKKMSSNRSMGSMRTNSLRDLLSSVRLPCGAEADQLVCCLIATLPGADSFCYVICHALAYAKECSLDSPRCPNPAIRRLTKHKIDVFTKTLATYAQGIQWKRHATTRKRKGSRGSGTRPLAQTSFDEPNIQRRLAWLQCR